MTTELADLDLTNLTSGLNPDDDPEQQLAQIVRAFHELRRPDLALVIDFDTDANGPVHLVVNVVPASLTDSI